VTATIGTILIAKVLNSTVMMFEKKIFELAKNIFNFFTHTAKLYLDLSCRLLNADGSPAGIS